MTKITVYGHQVLAGRSLGDLSARMRGDPQARKLDTKAIVWSGEKVLATATDLASPAVAGYAKAGRVGTATQKYPIEAR